MSEKLISKMGKEEFDAVINTFIDRETADMGELTAPLFYEALQDIFESDTGTEMVELEGEIINNQLVFHLPTEIETAVQVQDNEIVVGDQRIVVKLKNNPIYPMAG
ncbi:MAG: hypothetical protein KJ063_24550 [Anaerolineae bacterium]|nr:hypothetical protein [Anaerolineae bacterium]